MAQNEALKFLSKALKQRFDIPKLVNDEDALSDQDLAWIIVDVIIGQSWNTNRKDFERFRKEIRGLGLTGEIAKLKQSIEMEVFHMVWDRIVSTFRKEGIDDEEDQ